MFDAGMAGRRTPAAKATAADRSAPTGSCDNYVKILRDLRADSTFSGSSRADENLILFRTQLAF